MLTSTPEPLHPFAQALKDGEIVAYPCEGVWGLGCDPANPKAIDRLLALKQRPYEKGLILVAANLEQLAPYIAPNYPALQQAQWPGPHTYLIPASENCPWWIRGTADNPKVAARISAHPPVRALCKIFDGAITSTSANPAQMPPARSKQQVLDYFQGQIHWIMEGDIGSLKGATPIYDLENQTHTRPPAGCDLP
ncbi:MAG: L-threonylcarbamoyladenylate synthase [Gammaproteobacteria bacterium]